MIIETSCGQAGRPAADRLPRLPATVRRARCHLQQYLEVVGRAVSDLHLDASERAELAKIAAALGMNEAQVFQAHRRYVNELIDAAVDDDLVTDDEYDTLVRVASALGVNQDTVENRISVYRVNDVESRLAAGMKVVFTGDHSEYSREFLQHHARSIGLEPTGGVSKSTDLVCAVDTASRSGKAAKARKYGIPVISVDEFLTAEIGQPILDEWGRPPVRRGVPESRDRRVETASVARRRLNPEKPRDRQSKPEARLGLVVAATERVVLVHSGATEQHLVLRLDIAGVPGPHLFAIDDPAASLPTRPPVIRGRQLTGLWLLPEFARSVIWWMARSGWHRMDLRP